MDNLAQEKVMNVDDLTLVANQTMASKVAKLTAWEESLKGKELQLIEREKALKEKEIQLRLYRKNLLVAIKEQITSQNSYEENQKILEKYRDILQFIAQDLKDEIDEIMG